jgi:cell division inhibitor SulA/protein ImuA
MNLSDLLQRADIWRGGAAPPVESLPSGFAALDALLPGGGLPRGALTEILIAHEGIGELSLLLPLLARAARDERWLVFVAPPYIPYAPALARAGVDLARVLVVHPRAADGLWAVEQALRAGTASVVLAWLAHAEPRALRRLQLAAEAGGSLGILFRATCRGEDNSPAALRLKLEPASPGGACVAVHILKRRGGWPAGPVTVELDHAVARPQSARAPARGLHARGQ